MDELNVKTESENTSDRETGKLFRSAMGGFNKQDVTNYIERLTRDRRRDADRYGAHIRTLEEERAASEQEVIKLRAQIASHTFDTYTANREKEEANKAVLVLKSENEGLLSEIDALSKRLGDISAKPGSGDGDELTAALKTIKEQELEIERLNSVIASLRGQCEELRAEAGTQRRNGAADSAARPALQVDGAALIERIRQKAPSEPDRVYGNGVEELRNRIERARVSARLGISESNALYVEIRRNIDRLEEILRDLNG